MKIKICGITNVQDAITAANHNAWAIGFNFYPKSPRYIHPDQARQICSKLSKKIIKIGIVIEEQHQALAYLDFLNFLQVYQDWSIPAAMKKRLILALSSPDPSWFKQQQFLQHYAYLLIDAAKNQDGLLGGTGRLANWDLARNLSQTYPLILAGGIGLHNIAAAIETVQPFAVDVASSIEDSPGKKNIFIMKKLIKRCHHAK